MTIAVMGRDEMKHVEMIIDYVVDGDDFQYSDNHGVLIRCRDCVHNKSAADSGNANCKLYYGMTDQMGFCHMGERRDG